MVSRILFITFAAVFLFQCKKKEFGNTELIGHAGSGLSYAGAPYHDNSAESINYAIQMEGIQGVEIDIQCSRDGTAWLFHDPDLGTATNGTGCINSLGDDYLESLHYSTLKKEKLVKLKDLQFPFELKDLYLDIRTVNLCDDGQIPQENLINAISAALPYVDAQKINVIILNRDLIAGFHAKGWNVYYEVTTPDEYVNLDPALLSGTVGVCLRNIDASKDQVAEMKNLGKKVILFELRSPRIVRKALKKNADVLFVDDLKGAVIEKY